MKNILFALMAMISFSLFAQNNYEGTITYDNTYLNMTEEQKFASDILPKQTIIYFKGDKGRLETPSPMGLYAILFDKNGTEYTTLMGVVNKAIKEVVDKTQIDLPEVTYHDEYKTIAGYKCQKASIAYAVEDGGKYIVDVYFTEEIPNVNIELNYLKGMPLQYNTISSGIEVRLVANNVDTSPLDDNLFEIPDDFELTTREELFGGQ